MPPVRNQRSRIFCFTVNNYTADDEKIFESVLATYGAKYVGYGKEIAPTTGTPHLQGFLVFTNARSFRAVKAVHPKAHWTAAQGSFEQNRAYCSKGGQYISYGVEPDGQGARTDLAEAVALLRVTPSFHEFVKENPYVCTKYYSNLMKVHGHLHEPDYKYEKPTVVFIWGKTATNKSRRCLEYCRAEGIRVWKKDPATREWFDGYHGQEAVLLDDLRYDSFPFNQLLTLIDGYGTDRQVKGGIVHMKPKYWFITSDDSPINWYPKLSEKTKDQFYRRLTAVYNSEDTIDFKNLDDSCVRRLRGLEEKTQK